MRTTPRQHRIQRHRRVRKQISGTGKRPRLAVFRSNRHIYAQLIDDLAGKTLAAASSMEPALREAGAAEVAEKVGKLIASRAKEKGIQSVVFDRGGFLFHGRVKVLADAARGEGLEF